VSTDTDTHDPRTDAAVPSARALIWWAVVAGLMYTLFTRASSSVCAGGVSGDGGYVDADGRPTLTPPSCLNLELGPSWVVQLAVIVIVVWAVRRARRRPLAAAPATLQRARLAVVFTCLGSFAAAQTWFALLPVREWKGSGSFPLPFPFGWVETWISSMPG
jgi:hypothetical protein